MTNISQGMFIKAVNNILNNQAILATMLEEQFQRKKDKKFISKLLEQIVDVFTG